MAGSLIVECTSNIPEVIGDHIVTEVRRLGKERSIAIPKRINIHGAYGSWISLPYRTSAMKELILEVIKGMQMKLLYPTLDEIGTA